MSWLIVGGSEEEKKKGIEEVVIKEGGEVTKNSPDVVILENNGHNIGVEEVREFRKQLFVRPIGSLRIGIIEEAGKLTVEAQNALLKILEEPPDDCVIILCAQKEEDLLPTVLSRCFVIDLGSKQEISLDETEREKILEVIRRIDTRSLVFGFDWAKTISKRDEALKILDKLVAVGRDEMLSGTVLPLALRKIIGTKRYLATNTNVRLTMENMFL